MCQSKRSADESSIDGIRQRRAANPVANFTKPLAENSKFGFDNSGCLFRARDIVQAYWNAELSESEMDAVDAHTFICRKCANTVEVYHEAAELTLARMVIDPVRHAAPAIPMPHNPGLSQPAPRRSDSDSEDGGESSSASPSQEDDFERDTQPSEYCS